MRIHINVCMYVCTYIQTMRARAYIHYLSAVVESKNGSMTEGLNSAAMGSASDNSTNGAGFWFGLALMYASIACWNSMHVRLVKLLCVLCTCVYCVCVCVMCICVCAREQFTCMHIYIHAHTYLQHTCMHVSTCTHTHTYILCVHICMPIQTAYTNEHFTPTSACQYKLHTRTSTSPFKSSPFDTNILSFYST
jgi:hypothetical protein